MIEKVLGRRTAEDIFFSSMLACLVTEKQASSMLEKMEKDGGASLLDWAKGIGGALTSGGGMLFDTAKAIPPSLGWLALLGASTGGLGAMGLDVIKDQVAEDDPEAKFNEDLEAVYAGKERENKDSKWMTRVRNLRDELKRGYRKMTSSEYAKKYDELIAALDEKKVVA